VTESRQLTPTEFAALVVNASMLALREKVKKGAKVELRMTPKKPKFNKEEKKD
jgi:hypothetical protein